MNKLESLAVRRGAGSYALNILIVISLLPLQWIWKAIMLAEDWFQHFSGVAN